MSKVSQRKGASRKQRDGKPTAKQVFAGIVVVVKSALLLSLVGVCLWGGNLWLQQWLSKPVTQVTVNSPFERVTRADIEQLLAEEINDSFMRLDLDRIQQTLTAQPWIDRVFVKRIWPGTIDVSVTEHRPIARWGQKGVLNQRGELIELDSEELLPLQFLPLLDGPEGMESQLMVQYQTLHRFFKDQQKHIRVLRCDASRSWSLQFDDGVVLTLGRRQIEERIQRFLSLYELELQSRWSDLAAIDLRYMNGLAVQWREQKNG